MTRHTVEGATNCDEGNSWDKSICPDGETCASACCLDGVDYQSTYGIQSDGNALSLKYVTEHGYGTNVGSRVYLMESEDKYQMFELLGNEFTFDVDVSNIGCGLNGALYFVTVCDTPSPSVRGVRGSKLTESPLDGARRRSQLVPREQGGCQVRHRLL